MVVQDSTFLVELVDVYEKRTANEQLHVTTTTTPNNPNTTTTTTEWLVQVDPLAEYYIRLEVVGDQVDPDRVFLFYVSIDDTYLGYRQCLCRRDGFLNVGWYSFRNGVLVGIDQGIRFKEAALFEMTNNNLHEPSFRTDLIHMGNVTVKIYEGMLDGSNLSLSNNSEAFQPGQFLQTISLRCCASPEVGSSYLNRDDLERFKKVLMKRRAEDGTMGDAMEHPHHHPSAMMAIMPSTKRLKTETGSIAMGMPLTPQIASSAYPGGDGGGMDCDY